MKLTAAPAAAALLSLALLATTQCNAALVVKPNNARAPIDILGEHQPLERTWTIYSSSALQSLTFQGAGNVFVGFDAELKTDPAPAVSGSLHAPNNQPLAKPSSASQPYPPTLPSPPSPSSSLSPPAELLHVADGSLGGANDTESGEPARTTLQAVAKIVVSGDNEALLNAYSVVAATSSDGDSGLEIALSAGSSAKGGFVLTQLFVVQKSALAKVSAISSGDVVIGEGVLVTSNTDANVTLSSIGSGDIFVASNETLSVRSLEVQTAGSGDVQLQFATVNVSNAISLNGVASGNIALLAETVSARHIATTIVGSADLFVQASSVHTTTLETFLGGSGSVTVSKDGACVNQTITIAGSGDVRTGSIVCGNVDVSIFGSGDAVVQAENALLVTVVASGRVSYVNTTPKQVVIKGSIFRKHLDRRVTPAKVNKFKLYQPECVPACTPEYIHGKKHHRFNWWGLLGDDDSDDSDDSADSLDSSDTAPYSDDEDSDEHQRDSSKSHRHFRIVINDGSSTDEIVIGGDDSSDVNEAFPQPMRLAASATTFKKRSVSAASIVSVFGVAMGIVGVAAYKFKQRRARQQYRPLF